MDAEVIKTVDQLVEEVAEIRKLGKTWGFADEEIDECLLEALDATNQLPAPVKETPKSRGKLRKCIRYGFLTVLAFMAFIFLFFSVLSVVDEKTEMVITRCLVGISYPLLRYSRLMFLPVHRVFNVTDYYNAECLVNNPWFDDSPNSCWHCRRKKKVSETLANSTAEWRDDSEFAVFREVIGDLVHFTNVADVICRRVRKDNSLKGSLEEDLSFASLQEMFRTKKEILQGELRLTRLYSNRPDVNTLADVFEKSEQDIRQESGFHFQWMLRMPERNGEWRTDQSLASNRIIRQLFGRPSFISSTSEISFEKTVIIQSPGTDPHELDHLHMPSSWYIQVSGTRDVNIKPLPLGRCDKKCSSFNITLTPKDAAGLIQNNFSLVQQPGDTVLDHIVFAPCNSQSVVYLSSSWQVHLLPWKSNELSIGYMGSFA